MADNQTPNAPPESGADWPMGTEHQLALQQYRLRAPLYDHELLAFEPIRRLAVTCLALKPGATVIDVGCGTGLSFELLHESVGPGGQIVGIEQSPDMLDMARTRVARHGWDNVTLIHATASSAILSAAADAALFHFTHDILREPAALHHMVQHLKPQGRVVAAGLHWVAPWDWLTNWWVTMAAMGSVTTLEGLEQPWSLLAEELGTTLDVTMPVNGIYIASGVLGRRGTKRAALQAEG